MSSMLGKLLYELRDIHIISQRILDSASLKTETCITAHSVFNKTPIMETTTFWTMPLNSNNNRILYGEANGIVTTATNSYEYIAFRGHGLTYKFDNGRIEDRGSRIYLTSSSDGLSYFNGLIGVFEYNLDQVGNSTLKIWEWK